MGRKQRMQNAKCKLQIANCKLQNADIRLQNGSCQRRVLVGAGGLSPTCIGQFAFCLLHFSICILHCLSPAIVILALDATALRGLAAEAPVAPPDHATRQIYVPFSDLHVLLEQSPKRVLLGREEYDELVKKAKQTPETRAPRPAAVVAAEYAVTVGQQRAEIQGTLSVDVLEEGLHALPLDIGGVGLQKAELDNRNAAIGRNQTGQLSLFVQGVGRHQLMLEMVAPLETTAARQVLCFRLPRPAAARLRLTAPGDVEIKDGADVVSRTVDAAAKVTRFELLPREGDTSLVMTLNSHLQRQQRAVVARSVVIDQITQAYEKLHATVSLAILYRAVDQFQFAVPDGFEITEVGSPLLARWDVRQDGGRKLLHVRLREQTTETVVLSIAAIRTPGRLQGWSAPRLEPLDVVGGVTVLGLLVEERLTAQSLAAQGLIPIDTSVLSGALPKALQEAGPGLPTLRTVAAWYAPQTDYALTAEYKKPPAEMAVTTSLLLIVADKGQEVLGGLSLLPRVEKCFWFDMSVPAGWQIAGVTAAGGRPLGFERYAAALDVSPLPLGEGQGVRAAPASRQTGVLANNPHPNPLPKGEGTPAETAGRIRVAVPAGIPVGEEFKVNFRAIRTPPGWLAEWRSKAVEFPRFAVLGATRDEGAVAVDVRDDMIVHPKRLVQLTPLDAAEKPKYGLAGAATALAYRYQRPDYGASLAVERTRPRLSARTFSFLRIEPDAINCHYELIYNVEEARTPRLALLLPKDTPASLAIAGLDGAKLKEFGSQIVGDQRRWNVLLAQPQRDRVRLAVDFQQPLGSHEPKGLRLPIVLADGVTYQSGLAAVEGCAELEVRVDTPARRVDVGELAEADYQPGRRLLGAFGFVGEPPAMKIDVLRHGGYRLAPAIVEQCELDTNLSATGQSQTQARFKLRTKAVYLQVELPADAELWSAELDGLLLKPQREADRVLIDVPAGKTDAAQTLQVVYAVPVGPVALRGTINLLAPKLLLRADQGKNAEELPLADLVWRLHEPNGYEVVRAGGTVVTDDIERPLPAAVNVASVLYYLSGGFMGPPLLLPAVQASREAARRIHPAQLAQQAPVAESRSSRGSEASSSTAKHCGVQSQPQTPAEKRIEEALGFGAKPQPASSGPAAERSAPPAPKATPVAAGYVPAKKADLGLVGTRSLKIDVVQAPSETQRVLTFRSLGVEPRLAVTLVNQSRWSALGWGLALAVGLTGVAMTRRSARNKIGMILAVALVATLLPPMTASIEVAELCNMLFYAVCLLAPYYLLAGAARWLFARCRHKCAWCGTIMLATLLAAGANAEPPTAKPQAAAGPYVIQVVEPPAPVKLPEDAIILPYDPDWKNGVKDANKLLVPYEKYVELWNRAHPDKKIETKPAPAPYALAGSAYKTLLADGEYLALAGQVEIDVFSDGFVQIPLRLGGGVLAQAELDGKPARLSATAAVTEDPLAQPTKPLAASQLVLHVSGKGRHKLELAVRLRLSRQGGWRVAEGVLPAAPAAALAITIPAAQTELRLGQLSDRRSYETEKADEAIHTALGADGAVSIRWRPKVAEGQVDRSLTATSAAVLDVQEDGLRLVWRLGLEFRRSQRERFDVALPNEFLLEKVEGANVRGWQIRKTDQGQTVEISLLQAAKDNEQLTLHLWRAATVGRGPLAQFDVPLVALRDAALHTGQLTIRRSPLLELRTLSRSGVTRTDLPSDAAGLVAGKESPLGIRPFEAYSFATVPFAVRLAAEPVAARITATVQTVLRIAQYERSLESRATFHVQGRPIYQLQMLLPDDLRVDRVSAPGEFQYAVTERNKRPLLTIYLAAGRQGAVPVLVRGKLGRQQELKQLGLPQATVEGVAHQQGDLAVQVDPAFDVDATDLKNCQRVLLGRLAAWLNPAQQRVTRLGLHYTAGDYAGTLRLVPRTADVACDTISNVRVTDRAIEETILLDFTIRNAGVRELSFLLPANMAQSRISVPMLRQKTVEPVGKEAGSPLRVRIELQDEVMDQLRILVENDRLLTPGQHEAPIPTVELGRTNRRYVALESAGRDPVKVDDASLREMDALGRQQKEWAMLGGILGREMTLAYLVAPDARQPRLRFYTEQRAAVETVGAGIGLAETTLVVDANGAYRAQLVLRVDNSTEQFLEIRLPEGADLWTARVAGEPVKPIVKPQAAGHVRIPLIKTAPGELHYDVVLKYGGKMPAIGTLSGVAFPLIHCENIRPDLSQVRLYVPEQFRWFDFGGTMRLAAAEADLQAGYVKFQTRQTEQIMATLRQGDKFAKLRAAANLKTQQLTMDQYRAAIASQRSNSELQSELNLNASIAQQAEQESKHLEQSPQQAAAPDNRQQLGRLFQGQKGSRARNVVNDLGANWSEPAEMKPAGIGAADRAEKLRGDVRQQPSAAQVLGKEVKDTKEAGWQKMDQTYATPPARRGGDSDSVERYKERLEQKATQQGGAYLVTPSKAANPPAEPNREPASGPPTGRLTFSVGVPSDAGLVNRPSLAPAAQPNAYGSSSAAPASVATLPPGTAGVETPPAPPPATGLASLDFQLPARGVLYRFTVPRGEAEITARAFSNDLLWRLTAIAAVAVAALIAWLAVRLLRSLSLAWLAKPTGSTLLICLGLLSLCGGLWPGVGLAALVAGCGFKVHCRWCAPTPKSG
jgi:hypothetical protein